MTGPVSAPRHHRGVVALGGCKYLSFIMRTLPELILLVTTTAPTVGAVAIHALGEYTTKSLQQRQELPACYSPSGELNDGFYACNTTAQVSRCCPAGYTCFGSALCVLVVEPPEQKPLDLVTVTATVVREPGACTDPEWDGENCGGGYLGEFYSPYCVLFWYASVLLKCVHGRVLHVCDGRHVCYGTLHAFTLVGLCPAADLKQTHEMRTRTYQHAGQSRRVRTNGCVAQAAPTWEPAAARVTAGGSPLQRRRLKQFSVGETTLVPRTSLHL